MGGISNETIEQGESADFKCESSEKTNDITVYWMVGGDRFDCTATSAGQISSNGCYFSGSTGILLLKDTKAYGARSHTVQCVVQQNLDQDYVGDPSYDESFSKISKTGTLNIQSRALPVGDPGKVSLS